MNLNQFLIYIHSGAYDVAKQLLGKELSIKDRKQLRLVSQAANFVVLEYPILTTLYVSTFQPDLEYLELVSKNERLLKHVSNIWWNNSTFRLRFLLKGNSEKYYPRDARCTDAVVKAKREKSFKLCKAQGAAQRGNIENNRDGDLFARILPSLKNITSIVFTATSIFCFQRFDALPRNSPAIGTYKELRIGDNGLGNPIASFWEKYTGTYFPGRGAIEDKTDELLMKQATQTFAREIWQYLPVRGIKTIYDLSSQGQWDGSPSLRTGFQYLFPKLESIRLWDIPTDLITARGGGPVYQFLQKSMIGIQKLDLFLMQPSEEPEWIPYLAGVSALIQASSQSLRCLTVFVDDDSGRLECEGPLLRVMIELLPQLVLLSDLRLELPEADTTYTELRAFGRAIRGCTSLKTLEMRGLSLQDDETWEGALDLWKESGDLNGLSEVYLSARYYPEGDDRVFYETRRDSSIVNWLHGTTTQLPLEWYNEP